ncbi:MAG: hypothetical protein K0R70_2188 [Steroidobacteraceae bacterium]|jgi:hypothetical protein|nr:hypothetical protein [Steroidobacteraceae bacterium]
MDNVVAYFVASRRQVGTKRAMAHTVQRFGVTATEVKAELQARGLLLAQHPSQDQLLSAMEAQR